LPHGGALLLPRGAAQKRFLFLFCFFSPGGKQMLTHYSLLLLPVALACCSCGNSQRQKPEVLRQKQRKNTNKKTKAKEGSAGRQK